MAAYELGILAAQHALVPGHLKQAYARGFAGALEKRATDADTRAFTRELSRLGVADVNDPQDADDMDIAEALLAAEGTFLNSKGEYEGRFPAEVFDTPTRYRTKQPKTHWYSRQRYGEKVDLTALLDALKRAPASSNAANTRKRLVLRRPIQTQ